MDGLSSLNYPRYIRTNRSDYSNAQSPLNMMSLSQVLSTPLADRCVLLSTLLTDPNTPLRELAAMLPHVLTNIFGSDDAPAGGASSGEPRAGWSLALITNSCHPTEFQQIRRFLSPDGSLFVCINRLSCDSSLVYQVAAPALHPADVSFYSSGDFSKSLTDITSTTAAAAAVNADGLCWHQQQQRECHVRPLQLYLRHFCRYLTGSADAGALAWGWPGDALYPVLLEDLLRYYLPCGAVWFSSLPLGGAAVSSPAAAGSPGHGPSAGSASQLSTIATPHRLLRRDCLTRHNPSLQSPQQQSAPSHLATPPHSLSATGATPGGTTGYSTDTSSSQCVIATICQHWISTTTTTAGGGVGGYQQQQLLSGYNTALSLPSHDHIRLVRIVLKHVHYFINSPHHLPGLQHFKQQVQSLLQQCVFPFLSHCFLHWPSDSSYRLLVETWLSYVQPWRYLDYTDQKRSQVCGGGEGADGPAVGPQWRQFISANRACYSTMFQLAIGRMQCFQLTEPKFAYIIFRVVKVLCQPGLIPLLRQVENDFQQQQQQQLVPEPQLSSSGRYSSHMTGGVSAFDPVSDMGSGGDWSVTSQSLFGAACIQQVRSLVYLLADAAATLSNRYCSAQPPPPPPLSPWGAGSSSWLLPLYWWARAALASSLRQLSGALTGSGADGGDIGGGGDMNCSADQMKKTASHLQASVDLLTDAFQLPVPQLCSQSPEPGCHGDDETDTLSPGGGADLLSTSAFASSSLSARAAGTYSTPTPRDGAGRGRRGPGAGWGSGASPAGVMLTPSALQSPLPAGIRQRRHQAVAAGGPGGVDQWLSKTGAAAGAGECGGGGETGCGDLLGGDPELWPVRGDEVALLVRLTQALANRFNRTFEEKIARLYESDTFMGHLLHQILQPPISYRQLGRTAAPCGGGGTLGAPSGGGLPARAVQVCHVPARLSLRWLSSYRVLFYSALLLQLLAWGVRGSSSMLAVGPQLGGLVLLLLMACGLVLLRAAADFASVRLGWC